MTAETPWSELPSHVAANLLARAKEFAAGALGPREEGLVAGKAVGLPFYDRTLLVRLEASDAFVYVLWDQKDAVLPMNGTGAPVHAANALENFEVTADNAKPYLRLFCFAVRGSEGPFVLIEEVPEASAKAFEPLAAQIRPLARIVVEEEEGRFRFGGVIAYDGALFQSVFVVGREGDVEMVQDVPLPVEVDRAALPSTPDLSLFTTAAAFVGPADPSATPAKAQLGNFFERLELPTSDASEAAELPPGSSGPAPGASSGSPPPSAEAPTLTVLVELLLDRALRARSKHRLIESFNATQTATGVLDRFAALLAGAFPIVFVESGMPFVEETIAEIALERVKEPPRLVRAEVGADDAAVTVSVPTKDTSLVLLPLQVYRRVVNMDRLAYDLAIRNAAAIIACTRFEDVPDALRSLADVTLTLPQIDAGIFKELFRRVIGASVPANWADSGDHWVKYLLHSDFEQPRRLRLPPTEALEYVRASVTERLGAVETEDALGLKDLHGLGEARHFAEDLIVDIHAAIRGEIPWDHVDRGALLIGPPGTGKTTLARAIAKDCGVRFINASATDWQASSEHLGHHLAAVSKTFAEARMYAPSILFIDEVDSIGNRELLSGHGAQYQLEVVNAVLEQVQDLDPTAPVFVIGATNHEERVDPALQRSGRLDRVIRIPRPNSEALARIYDHYLERLTPTQEVASTVDTTALGGLSLGLTGADVERIVRGAARRARRERTAIDQHHLFAEVSGKPRYPSGSHRMTPEEIERVAFHEAGHALAMSLSASGGEDIGYVTIVPRADGALGFVAQLPDDRVSLTRRDYEELLRVGLAGRAAEEVRFGEDGVSGGASHDLMVATRIATTLITRLGLSTPRSLVWSESLSERDYPVLAKTLSDAYKGILADLRAHEDGLTALAKALIERQELTGEEARKILAG